MVHKKFLKIGIVSTMVTFMLGGTTFAAEWQNQDGVWRYQKNNGSYASEEWAKSGEDWYYLGGDERMQTEALIEDGNYRYYVDATGKMVRNNWISITDSEDENQTIWYYFGSDGKAYYGKEGRVSTKEIDGKHYLFNTEGRMLKGFITENGEVVEESENYAFLGAKYYFGEDGAMYQEQWLRYEDTGMHGLYSELAQRYYSEFEELWLYFDQKGKKVMAKDNTASKVKNINGLNYHFDENGVMISRLAVTNAELTATNSNAKIRYGSTDTIGEMKEDYWTFMVPNEEMDEEDYHQQEFSWFRTRKNGHVIKNRISEVLGRKYAFDGIGRMQTGFVVMYQDGTFGKQYDIDDWSRADFLVNKEDSLLLPLWRGNLYLFGTDELNDGSMKTGPEVSVILEDGPATFGFRPNGIAYGNRYTLEHKDGRYYYNGLRLEANQDIGYGVVKDTRFGMDKYVVIDSQGRVVKGKKRIIQDNEGYWIIIRDDRFYARIDTGDKPRWKNGNFYYYDSTKRQEERFSTDPIVRNTGIDGIGFEILYNTSY